MKSRGFLPQRLNLRIAALVLVSVAVAMASMVWFVDSRAYRLTYDLQTRAMGEAAKSASRALNDSVGDHLQLIRNLSSQEAIVGVLGQSGKEQWGEDAHRYVRTLMGSYTNIWSLYVIGMDGVVVAGQTTRGDDLRGKQRGQHPEIQAALKGSPIMLSKSQQISDIGEVPIYTITSPVKDGSGKVIGACRVAVNITSFNKEYIGTIKAGDTGYAFMMDAEGKILAHPEASLVLKTPEQPFFQQIARMKNGTITYAFNGQEKVASFRQDDTTGWITVVTVPMKEVLAGAYSLRTAVGGIGVAVCIILAAVLVLATRSLVVRPILAIQRFAGEVAAGNYKAGLSGSFSCELSTLGANIIHMTDELKSKLAFSEGVLRGITSPMLICDTGVRISFLNRQVLSLLGKPGSPEDYLGLHAGEFFYGDASRPTISERTLRENRALENNETETTMPDGSRRFVKVDSSPISNLDGEVIGAITIITDVTDIRMQTLALEEQNRKIAEAARGADTISDQLSTAAEELSAQIEESSRGTEHQRERLAETATAVEQMSSSVMDVAKSSSSAAESAMEARAKALAGEQVVERAQEAFGKVEDSAQAMKEQVEDLSLKASSIDSIMQIIEDIADQTNLLALNAAIEAARAGDAGRGFAVVADEVRKLAEKTMGATKDVGRSIQDIQSSIERTLGSMDEAGGLVAEATVLSAESGRALKEIVNISGKSEAEIQAIANAAEEQSAASEQIARSAAEVRVIASETADAMSQSANAVSDLARMASALKELIRHMQA